ncbi:MAG TPA: hypothetical protein VND41_02965 [Nitrososphaerales archaeon]|nr:hypothetical protein [Nitrososphaerales archaeon]
MSGTKPEVLKTARELIPFVFKKKDELQTIIDCREDKIAGTEVFERFKALQDLGIREKNRWPAIPEVKIPYRRIDGYRLMKHGREIKNPANV